MITIVRYLLVATLPGWIIYAYSIFNFISIFEKSTPQKMIFERYDYSWGDNTPGSPDIYAKGRILGNEFTITIGYQGGRSKIDRFESEELSNLEEGDTIPVWSCNNPIGAVYRPPKISKEQYIYEYKKKYLINYTIYIIFLITFEYLFRKEWKKKGKERSANYFKN